MSSPNPPLDAGTSALTPTTAPVAGRVLAGRYKLEALLASGGMAQVWRGADEVLRRQVAVKLLHPHLAADATFVERFRQEAVAAARLAHPGIVAIYDTCSEGGAEAIVMELVVGRTLRERLDDDTPIDPWQAAGLAAQVAEALDAAHRAGLVHRDIKPANVLLSADGRVKVADFGIAKALADADLTQPGLMVGTAKYLAPEQVRGDAVDARTDIYSLGVVLYEMLCGRPPFVADTDAATALARLQRDPLRPRQVRAGVPKALEEVVCRAMAREPAERYATAADLRAALLAAGAASPDADLSATTVGIAADQTTAAARPRSVEATEAPVVPPPSFRQTERSWLVPTVVVVLVALTLGVAGLLLGRSGAGTLLDDVRDAIGGPSGRQAAPLEVRAAAPFDPVALGGDGRENGDLAPNVLDGDPATAWRTEGYDDRDITRLKSGVGLVLELARPGTLDALEITSPTNDWQVVVYVADRPADSLEGWGEPAVRPNPLPEGTNTLALGGKTGGAVLVWILDRGDEPGRAAAEIQDIRVLGH